ncbi:MAG: hypothetical protein V3S43_06135 [Acidimicrobiia bacterium]
MTAESDLEIATRVMGMAPTGGQVALVAAGRRAENEWCYEHTNKILRALGNADTDAISKLLKEWTDRNDRLAGREGAS